MKVDAEFFAREIEHAYRMRQEGKWVWESATNYVSRMREWADSLGLLDEVWKILTF